MGERGARQTEPDYATQWTDERLHHELTLPTGRKVIVQHPDVLALAKLGRLPDHLFRVVEMHIFGLSDEEQAKRAKQSPLQLSIEGQQYIDVVVAAACVQPRVVFGEPGPDEVSIDRLHSDEKYAIWKWSQEVAQPLVTFPERGDGASTELSAVADGDSVPNTSKHAPGPHRAA